MAATAPRAHQPFAPIEDGHLGTVSLGHFGRVGLDLMLTRLAPHDQPHARSGRVRLIATTWLALSPR
jgi:hypothetical protein